MTIEYKDIMGRKLSHYQQKYVPRLCIIFVT